jgi:hypothetical protein
MRSGAPEPVCRGEAYERGAWEELMQVSRSSWRHPDQMTASRKTSPGWAMPALA